MGGGGRDSEGGGQEADIQIASVSATQNKTPIITARGTSEVLWQVS